MLRESLAAPFPFARIVRATPHREGNLCVTLVTPRGEERLVVSAEELLDHQRFEATLLGRLGLMLEDTSPEIGWRQLVAKALSAGDKPR